MSDNANGFLALNENLTYQAPQKIQDGDVNYVSFKPQSIGTYGPGSTVDFRLRSSNEFVILDRSYLKFTLKETGAVAAAVAGTKLSTIGAVACINQVADTISGLNMPILKEYNLQQGVKLHTDTSERKAITEITQGYGGIPDHSGANTRFPARTFCIPVPTSLDTANKVIPLSILNGGWNIGLTLEQGNRVFINQAVGNSYEVYDLEIVCAMLKPDEKYLQELGNAMARQGSLKIPLVLTKHMPATLTGSTTQVVRLQSGYLGSLNTITNIVREASKIGAGNATTAVDTFETNTDKLSSYYYNINSNRYPRNKQIHGGADPESLMMFLSGFNSSYSHLNPFTVGDKNVFAHYSFQSNGEFSSGIQLSDGFVNIDTTFSVAPTSGDRWDSFLAYDALLIIDASTVNLLIDI